MLIVWASFKAYIEYSDDIDDIQQNIEYNPNKKQNIDHFWWYDCWFV